MPSSPRTPKSTIKIRRLPKVGETILIPVTVTRVAPEGDSATVTVRIKGNGQLTTAKAEHLLPEE